SAGGGAGRPGGGRRGADRRGGGGDRAGDGGAALHLSRPPPGAAPRGPARAAEQRHRPPLPHRRAHPAPRGTGDDDDQGGAGGRAGEPVKAPEIGTLSREPGRGRRPVHPSAGSSHASVASTAGERRGSRSLVSV